MTDPMLDKDLEDIDIADEADLNFNGGKPSLKEIWNSSPGLKIAAIAAALVLSVGGYAMFKSGGEETKSIVRVEENANLKQTPGQNELDPVYRAALEETNARIAEEAAQTGGSAVPTPINAAKTSGLDVALPEKPQEDPLAEWRRLTESRRLSATTEDENGQDGLPAELAPLAQPIRPQMPVLQQDPKAAEALVEQMRVVLAAQAPASSMLTPITAEPSLWSVQKAQREAAVQAQASGVSGQGGTSTEPPAKVIVPAGSIAYAQLLTEINSDIKGPALVHILSGPFAGARAIGKMEVKEDFNEHIVLTFKTIVKDAVSYTINGIAMDEKTTLTGQATDVDHHYMQRVVLPAAAAFIEGYSQSLAESGSDTQVSGLVTITTNQEPDAKDSLYEGLTQGVGRVADMLNDQADRPITVKIAKGTTMGILFLDSVTAEDAIQ